jgi:hypothetical protein
MNLRTQFVQLRRVSRVNDNPLSPCQPTKKLPKYKNHWEKKIKFFGPVTEHLQRSPIEGEGFASQFQYPPMNQIKRLLLLPGIFG